MSKYKGTFGKLLAKTDIPLKATAAPGNTVKTKNIVVVSGPSTWKERTRQKAKAKGDSSVKELKGKKSPRSLDFVITGDNDSTLQRDLPRDRVIIYDDALPETNPGQSNGYKPGPVKKSKPKNPSQNHVYVYDHQTRQYKLQPVAQPQEFERIGGAPPQGAVPPLELDRLQNSPPIYAQVNKGGHNNGSPFPFNVTDATKVSATGEGLELVPCGKPAAFTIEAPGASPGDLDIRIIGPTRREVTPRIYDNGRGTFTVEYTPHDPGDYNIDVRYHGNHINNSPFTARAWDHNNVIVSNIRPGKVGKPCYFNIDASKAGAGNLEIIVSVAGENVPNFVKAEGNARYEVSFTPQVADTHYVSVKFNGESVPGSPFYCALVDGTRVSATGDGLRFVPANHPAHFNVRTHGVGDAQCTVDITGPSGRKIPTRISGNSSSGYHVEYTPFEVGRHMVNIEYADTAIQGSPFYPEVYDPAQIHVGDIEDGSVGKPLRFMVDTSRAGDGTLGAEVRGRMHTCHTEIVSKGGGQYEVTFTPRENTPHTINLFYNNEPVPGGPFTCNMFDVSAVYASWDKLRMLAVGETGSFDVDPRGMPNAIVTSRIVDAYDRQVPCQVIPQGRVYRVEFTPTTVGQHSIDAQCGGQSVPGSPYTCQVYDPAKVRMVEVDTTGVVGQAVSFVVDTSDAGQGDVEVDVTCNGQPVRVTRQRMDMFKNKFTFIPNYGGDHRINVTFNGHRVLQGPTSIPVSDPMKTMVVTGKGAGAVDRMNYSYIQTQGASIDPSQWVARVQAPTGELVPAKIVQQPDGDYKVEYSSRTTGRHTVEILYAGQAIMGSPFYVEIYDPNKIRVEGSRNGMVGQRMEFEIIRNEAGKAELGMSIISPSGRNIPYDLYPTSMGDRVNYVPQEPGPHHINITYGGLEVPGCPVTQNINSAAGTVTVYGSGLQRAEEHKPATFYVDSKGHRGDLFVQVDSPNSIAKCNIEPDESGRYVVTYTPVEVGMYMVTVKWNGRDVEGSPFQVKVAAPSRVMAIGGWESMMDTMGRIPLAVNQMKRIEFETRDAGSGRLTAEIRGPDGVLPAEVEQRGSVFCVTFIPRMEGEHYINLYFNDVKLPRFPMIGYATGGAGMGGMSMGVTGMGMNTLQASNQMNTLQASNTLQSSNHVTQMSQVTQNMSQMSMSRANHEKVVLTGRGLKEAVVRQEAEFVIDGTEAGSGTPTVRLTGVNQQIVDVKVFSLGDNKYKAAYTATIPGAYLLDIKWSERQVRGSPFKVNVIAASDATKVVCSGDGLRSGIMGRDIQATIDTRRAGPGELTAHCMGPSKVAFCELFDHRDGTFGLHIKPQEAGRHALQIKYGGQHVPGSPYELKVASAPDASKVRVTGPGVEHGILATYQSRFICETNGAGAGQLTVRIRGPKGAFRVEMQRESQKDRTILCRYDPTEVGDYIISVKWSGVDVPGSPFNVQIFDTQQEVERFHQTNPGHRPQQISARTWSDEF